jgi:hypothetical protein
LTEFGLALVTAWGTSFGAAAAKARLPAPIMLPIAATVRNRRRVVSTGVFVGGVLSTQSAWVIWVRSPYWLGLEPGRKRELPLGLLFWYTILMTKSISRTRKSRGRPSTGAESVHLRVLPDQYAAIDAWIMKQKEPSLTRPEAIRRLVEIGLKAKK